MTSSRKYKCPLCHRCHRHRFGRRLRNMFTNKSTPPPSAPVSATAVAPSGPPVFRLDAPPARMGNLPLSNGKILLPAQGKFFLSPEKKFSLPSTLGTPSPSPACALQRHAPVPRHTATHARRRAMRKITTSHASATIPNDDDTIKNEVDVYAQEARANDDTDDDDTDDNGVLYIQRASAGDLYKTKRGFRVWKPLF